MEEAHGLGFVRNEDIVNSSGEHACVEVDTIVPGTVFPAKVCIDLVLVVVVDLL